MKTKSIMRLMKDKVAKGDADVDIVEYSLATKMLENKLQVLQALNIDVESSEDKNKITLNVHGSNKSIEIDLAKLREAITIHDKKVEEKEVVHDGKGIVENIDIENITEEEFMKLAVEKILPVQKSANKTLTKESFIKIFKYTGDYAKIKSRDVKAKAQERRAAEFGKDPKKYLEALKSTVQEEEQAYEKSSQEMFEKLCISPEMFERSQ